MIHIIRSVITGAFLALSGSMAYASSFPDTLRYPSLHYAAAPRIEWSGDSLVLCFSCSVEGRLKGPVSLHAVPLYITGNDTLRYPVGSFYTRSGARYHLRRRELSDGGIPSRPHVVNRGSRVEVDYREALPVPSSPSGRLCILQVMETCCEEVILSCHDMAVPSGLRELPSAVLPPPVAVVNVPLFGSNLTFIEPNKEAVKERAVTIAVHLTYPVDKWRVHLSFGENIRELDRVDRLLTPVVGDTATYKLQDITIAGYASPEGTYAHNLELSGKRAAGMRDYLRERYLLPSSLTILSEGKGEDWEGLRTAVEGSAMPEKSSVLSIIDHYDIFDGREKRLMELKGGSPYRYMLDNLFPPLRRMEMKIDYRVRAFGVPEAEELIDVRSRDLSLYEMYGVARSRNDDRTIRRNRHLYGREYDIAVRWYPDDATANINASSAALVRGDLETAWLCLNKVKENRLAYNNLGVYHWLCGKTEEAKAYFLKAAQDGSPEAVYNLEQFIRWEKEFDGDGNGKEEVE